MTHAKKILFITQEINPYQEGTELSVIGRAIPQQALDCGREIRNFMPKWGDINERRSQLHEVIRLSGMNLIIDDTDHLLIIKVASIPSSRMQVYFIDNDDYFQKRNEWADDNGIEYGDNGERAIFYARGVLETVKKLRWVPDIIHCQGWMSCIVPLYLKLAYGEEPSFRDSKIVFTPCGPELKRPMSDQFCANLLFKGVTNDTLETLPNKIYLNDLYKMALQYSDALMLTAGCQMPELVAEAEAAGKPIFFSADAENTDSEAPYIDFFDKLWSIGKENKETD
ncbi:MAG: glycogen/starch synthase [Bacteroidaceae bacterium]|nr:glycogen/starch synthase [Bacteroidaceae bacterium]